MQLLMDAGGAGNSLQLREPNLCDQQPLVSKAYLSLITQSKLGTGLSFSGGAAESRVGRSREWDHLLREENKSMGGPTERILQDAKLSVWPTGFYNG